MDTSLGILITAVVTPFADDGSVNHTEFRRLLRHLVETGSDGIVVAGTTGESPTLSDDEKLALFATAVDEVGGTVPVIAGTGSNATAHSVELTRRACELGIDGVLVVAPYYNKPPREGLVKHFQAVAQASTVPVIVYNIPSRVVINLEPDLLAELAQIDNVIAVKQANPDLDQTRTLRRLAPELAVYAGNDDSLLPLLDLGAVGGICVSSHVLGAQMRHVIELHANHQRDKAVANDTLMQQSYATLNASNPISIKAAVTELGFQVGAPRLPLVPATEAQVTEIRRAIERQQLTGVTV